MLFVNGLPLGVMELKNPTDENATIRSAFQQLQTCKAEIVSRAVAPEGMLDIFAAARLDKPGVSIVSEKLAAVKICERFQAGRRH